MRHWWLPSFIAASLLAGIPSLGRAQPAVTIEVNDTSATTHDYLCWAPIRARARLAAPGAAQTVTLRSTSHAKIFAATRDNRLWARNPLLRDVAWQHVGHANNVVGMAGIGGWLFCGHE